MALPGFNLRPTVAAGDRADEGCLISLDRLKPGQCGVVMDLELANSDDGRLRTLGICPGRRVWLVRKGDPMVVRVMNTRLGLARQLARQVTVEVCLPPCSIATDVTPPPPEVPPEVKSPDASPDPVREGDIA